jgi:predicted transcriptional regulator YdeE
MSEKTEKTEKSPIVRGKNGGKRPGAGMPKGKKTAKTIKLMSELEKYRARVTRYLPSLFVRQLSNAQGIQYYFRKEEDENGRITYTKVVDLDEIEMCLEEIGEASGAVQGGYYIYTVEKPDNKAIDSMLDRTFGKPTQTLDINHSNIKEVLDEQDKEEQIDV